MRAISPLVAAVLLIAISLTLAGLVGYWAVGFVKERTTMNATLQEECLVADFSIYQCSYDQASENLTLILNNLRNVELRNISVWLFYADQIVLKPINEVLPPLYYKEIEVSNVSSGFSKVEVRTHCPEVSRSTAC